MAIYTLSLNFLKQLESSDMPYLASILFCFTNEQHPDKLAVDKNKIILSTYREIVNERFGDIIKTWVDMLSYIPSSMEKINVDLSEIEDCEKCLLLCSKTNGVKQMIVYSLGSIGMTVNDQNCIRYNDNLIKLIDKDEAKSILNQNTGLYISNSIVANGNVEDCTNNYGQGNG